MPKKIVDSTPEVSPGGRVSRYWNGRPVISKSSRNITTALPKGVGTPIDQYDVIKLYQLKGFEYGNWVNNNDRVDKLKAATLALRDLSRIMGSTNLGLDGTLGIAFGARGNSAALAHFEPSTFMINLTKTRGDHSFGHEYGHAIDYFFGMYIDQNKNYSSLVGGSSTARKLDNNKGGEIRSLANKIIDNIIMDGPVLSESYSLLLKYHDTSYWKSRNEIWARFFEQYVSTVLTQMKVKNPFLVKSKYETSAYLTKKDFDRVKPAMDTFISLISRKMNEAVKRPVQLPAPRKKVASKKKRK